MKSVPLTILALLATIVFSLIAYTEHPIAGAVVAVVCLFIVFNYIIKFSGLTLAQKRALRKHRKTTKRTDRYLFSTFNNEIAATWDGESMSMFLELSPAPLQTVAFTDEGKGIPEVPIGIIAENLRRFDISVDDVYINSYGYQTLTESPYEKAYKPALKSQLTRWKTYIEVSMRLENSMSEIETRRGDAATPEEAYAKAVNVATQRMMRYLLDAGWRARVLNQGQVEAMDKEISGFMGDIFDHEHKNNMGKNTQWAAVYASNSTNFDPLRLNRGAEAIGVIRHIRPVDKVAADIDTYVALFGQSRESVSMKRKGLKKLPGVQGDVVSYLLPQAPNNKVFVSRPTHSVSNVRGLKLRTGPAWGIGSLIGETVTQPPLNAALTTTSGVGQVLYVAAHVSFVRNLISRMAASGESVAIELSGDDWKSWVEMLSLDRVTTSRINKATVVVTASRNGASIEPRAGVLMVCLTPQVPLDARYSIEQLDSGVLRVVTGQTYRDVKWIAEEAERNWWAS